MNTKQDEINDRVLQNAIKNTFSKRSTEFDINNFSEVLADLKQDKELEKLWKRYQEKNKYAQNIDFNDTILAIEKIMKILEEDFITT